MSDLSSCQTSAGAAQRAVGVTPWFSAAVMRPVRDGWYETMWSLRYPGADGPGYVETQFALGGQFFNVTNHGYKLTFVASGLGDIPGDVWRGLRQPAAAPPSRNARSDKKKAKTSSSSPTQGRTAPP